MSKNINHLQHIKSNVVENGTPKLPSASVLVEGEIAVNYADGYETLSIKTTSGKIATFSSDTIRNKEQKVISASLNDLNDRIESLSGDVTSLNEDVSKLGETIHYLTGMTSTAGGTNLSASWSGNCPEVTELYTGLCVRFVIPAAGHKSGDTLSINGEEKHAIYYGATSKLTTQYASGTVLNLTYDADTVGTYYNGSEQVSVQGVWRTNADYSISNTDTIGYSIGNNQVVYKTDAAAYRYMLLLQKDETTLTPVNTTSNVTAGTKTLTTSEFDPFGDILYKSSTGTTSANSNLSSGTTWKQYALNLAYSFNTTNTLETIKSVYMVAVPQSNGKAVLHSSPISQTLPTTDDGLIYIYLGQAYSTTSIYLMVNHPVYQFKNGQLRKYVGSFGTMAYENASSYSSATEVNAAFEDLNEQSETISMALNVLNENKLDSSAFTDSISSIQSLSGDVANLNEEVKGFGRESLEENIVDGTNTLTQAMLNSADTIYSIAYDYVCDGNITVPENCVLEFNGGSISGGNITLQNTYLNGDVKFDSTVISGSCANDVLMPQMFGAYPTLTENESNKVQHTIGFKNLARVLNNANTKGKAVFIPSGHYSLNDYVVINSESSFYGNGDSSVINIYDGSGCLAFGYNTSGTHYFDSCEELSCTITEDAEKEQDYIMVDDVSNLNIGDYLILTDSNDGSFTRSRVYYRQSEIVKISNIENNRVTFTSKLYGYYYANFGEDYYTSLNPAPAHRTVISKFSPKQYNISNIKVISHEHNNANPTAYHTFIVCGHKNSYFSGIHVENYGNYIAAALYLGIQFEINNCVIRNYATYTTDAYGLGICNSQEFKVSNSKFRAPSHALATGGGSSTFSPINRIFIYDNLYFENASYDSSQKENYDKVDLDVHSNAENYKFFNINCPHTICDTGGYNVVIDGCKFYKISASFNNSDMTIKNCEIFTTNSDNLVWNENVYSSLGNNSIVIENTKFHGKLLFNYQGSSALYDNFIFRNNNINGYLHLRNGKLKNLVVENNTFDEGGYFIAHEMQFNNISFKHNVILDGYLDIISWSDCNAVITDNYVRTITDNGTSNTQTFYFRQLYGYISNNIIERRLENGHTPVLLVKCDMIINNNIIKLGENNRNKQLVASHDSRVILENNTHNCIANDLIEYEQGSITSFGFSDYYKNLTSGFDRFSITNAVGRTFYNRETNRLGYVSPVGASQINFIVLRSDNPYIGNNIFSPGKFYILVGGAYCNFDIYLSKYNDVSDPDFENGLLFVSNFNYGKNFIQIPYEGVVEDYPYYYIETDKTSDVAVRMFSTRIISDFDGAGFNVRREGTTAQRPIGSDMYVGFKYIDTDLGKPIFVKSINSNTYAVVWVESDGAIAGVKRIGTTSERPTGSNIYVGFKYIDTTLGKEIYASAISGNTVTWTELSGGNSQIQEQFIYN